MRLHEIDWSPPSGAATVEIEYPDDLIAPFVNWLRRSSRWKDDQHAVEEKLMGLNARLRDYRESGAVPVKVVTALPKPDRFAAARLAKQRKKAERLAAVG